MFYRILNQVGTFLFPRPSPFGLWSALWLDLLSGEILARGLFCSPPPPGTALQALLGDGGGSFFAFMRLLRNFQWYDFASIFVYGKVWTMGQEYPPEKDTKHSAPAPLRRRLHEFYCGRSRLCRSSSRKANRAHGIVQNASKRSNGLSRKRVPSSGEYSCPIVPTLPNSNHRKSQNHTTKILATE